MRNITTNLINRLEIWKLLNYKGLNITNSQLTTATLTPTIPKDVIDKLNDKSRMLRVTFNGQYLSHY